MKLQIVSATGLKPSEIKAVRKLEAQLPNSWVGYASFLMNDGQGTGMEVDLLIITADRFILCEVKEWRGTIRSDGRSWYQSVGLKERQHPSPVAIKREHTQRVRSLLNNAMKSLWGGFYTVDFMIIMAGDALITQMPDNEKSFVMSLDEFSTIGNPELYKQYMPRNYSDYLFTENKLRRPNDTSQIAIFERWMRGGDAISKRYRQESNYMMSSETPIFEQLSYKAYAEYTGEHVQVSGSKALMRLWNFSALGAYASTSSQRANLGLREQRVNLYVQEKNYNLKKDYLMNPLHSYDPEECTEDMIEVFEHSPILKRLDQHLNTLPKTPEARINLMRAVLTPLAELHVIGVAHRDIGFERFWYDAYSKAVIISGLVTARFPEVAGNKSVSDVCSILSSNNISLPEELLGETEIDGKRSAASPFSIPV